MPSIYERAGAWGEINPVYRAYARSVGFHIDACGPGESQAKGKVEAKVRLSRLLTGAESRPHAGLEGLQTWTDERVARWAVRTICPATGLTVRESWEAERGLLGQPDRLPVPFDVVATRTVGRDCLVAFEGRSYCVPFRYAGGPVEVRGCATTVQVWAEGSLVIEYPRHTPERLLLDPACYEGPSTDRVAAPTPLGRMGRKLQEFMELPVERRPLDWYAALAEVAR